MKRILILILVPLMGFSHFLQAQVIPGAYDSVVVDYANPKQYVIGGVTVTGTQYLDKDICS